MRWGVATLCLVIMGCELPSGTLLVRYRTFSDDMEERLVEELDQENTRITEILGEIETIQTSEHRVCPTPQLRK